MEKERKRESVGGLPALSQGNITGLISFIMQTHLLPATHFCLFVSFCFGRIPLVSREVEALGSCLLAVPAWEHSSQRWLLSSSPLGR